MDRYQVVPLVAAVYVVDNDAMQASRFAGDWNAHASCELLNSGAMPRADLDWIDLEPESGERQMRCPGCDCEPVGYAPHNGKGDCPAARSSRSSPTDQTDAPYR